MDNKITVASHTAQYVGTQAFQHKEVEEQPKVGQVAKTISWGTMPVDALLLLGRHLTYTDHRTVPQVCQHWHRVFTSDEHQKDLEMRSREAYYKQFQTYQLPYAPLSQVDNCHSLLALQYFMKNVGLKKHSDLPFFLDDMSTPEFVSSDMYKLYWDHMLNVMPKKSMGDLFMDGTYSYRTLLKRAIQVGHEDLVSLILENIPLDDKINLFVSDGTILRDAIQCNQNTILFIIMRHFPSEMKRDLYTSRIGEAIPFSMAILYGNSELAQALYNDCSLDVQKELFSMESGDLGTPLHHAAYSGNKELVQWVLTVSPPEMKPLLFLGNRLGVTPVHLAARHEDVELIAHILNVCPPEQRGNLFKKVGRYGNTPMDFTAKGGDLHQFLLEQSANYTT